MIKEDFSTINTPPVQNLPPQRDVDELVPQPGIAPNAASGEAIQLAYRAEARRIQEEREEAERVAREASEE